MKQTLIRIDPLTYYGQRDEEIFFQWLDTISCFAYYTGRKENVYIVLSSYTISVEDYRSLEELFKRYGIPLKRLSHLHVPEWKQAIASTDSETAPEHTTLMCHPVHYYSSIDEDICFEWIQRILAIADAYTTSTSLCLYIHQYISEKDASELQALHKRYCLDIRYIEQYIDSTPNK